MSGIGPPSAPGDDVLLAARGIFPAGTEAPPHPLTRWLIWSNLLMAGCAAGWVVLTTQSLALPVDGVLIALAFVLALGFYTRDRLDEGEQQADQKTMPQRTAWMQRHAAALRRLVWLCFIAAIALLVLRPAALPAILAGLGFALTYVVRWLPWRGKRVGWKHLPGMKMPFVALLWTLLTVIAPAAVYGRLAHWETWILALAVSFLVMAQILLNDLRDQQGDRISGTASLPVLLGDTNARRVGYGLVVVAASLGLFVAPVPIGLTALFTLLLLRGYQLSGDSRYRPWIEAQGIVAGLLALL